MKEKFELGEFVKCISTPNIEGEVRGIKSSIDTETIYDVVSSGVIFNIPVWDLKSYDHRYKDNNIEIVVKGRLGSGKTIIEVLIAECLSEYYNVDIKHLSAKDFYLTQETINSYLEKRLTENYSTVKKQNVTIRSEQLNRK